jgi:protein subunit release factor B
MITQPVRYATDQATIIRLCTISFLRGSGPGGQNRNKVETGVRLIHGPSGITVTATDGRSQEENRRRALKRLQWRLYKLNNPPKPRLMTRVSKAQKRQRLSDKRIQSARKQARNKPIDD